MANSPLNTYPLGVMIEPSSATGNACVAAVGVDVASEEAVDVSELPLEQPAMTRATATSPIAGTSRFNDTPKDCHNGELTWMTCSASAGQHAGSHASLTLTTAGAFATTSASRSARV